MISNYRVYSPERFPAFSEIAYASGEESNFTYALSSEGKTFDDYRNAYKKIASFYGIPIIDLLNVGFSFFRTSDRQKYSYPIEVNNATIYDGLHPSILGGEKMADYIYSQLLSIM